LDQLQAIQVAVPREARGDVKHHIVHELPTADDDQPSRFGRGLYCPQARFLSCFALCRTPEKG